jgi:hypothetical protein
VVQEVEAVAKVDKVDQLKEVGQAARVVVEADLVGH